MANNSSCLRISVIEDRLAMMEADFKRIRDFIFSFPIEAIKNANSEQILELRRLVHTIRQRVPSNCTQRDFASPSSRPLRLEDRIEVMQSNLDQMKDYLSCNTFEVIESANAAAISELRRVILELKHDVETAVLSTSARSPYSCSCPNGFNAPEVVKLTEDAGRLLKKKDELKHAIYKAISDCGEHGDLMRLKGLIEEEDDFVDYEPPIPSPYDDYTYDSDRSLKGKW